MRTIKEAMTPFPYSVAPDTSGDQARRMMEDHEIHHLPVKAGGDIVGVVSAADLERARADVPAIAAVMQTDPYVVELGSSLEDVLLTMAERHIECVLVTKAGRLAGIFTVVDACRAFSDVLRSLRPEGGNAA